MATLSIETEYQLAVARPLVPVASDAPNVGRALVSAQQFGPFKVGDCVTLGSTMPFHVLAGDKSVAATTSCAKLPAGVYPFVMPDGATYVSLIDSSDGAGVGQCYAG